MRGGLGTALAAPVRQGPARPPLRGWPLALLVWRVTLMNLAARLEYRADFLMWLVFGIAGQATMLAFIWVILADFHALHGWSRGDILFMYGLRLLGHALYLPVFRNLIDVPTAVRQGSFDRYLVRPVNPLLQVLTQSFTANSAGDLVVAIALLAVAQGLTHLRWNALSAGFLVLVLAGAVLMEAAIQLASASLSFWAVDSSRLSLWLDTMGNTFANYPLDVFARVVRYFLTFVVPVAFLGYFPAAVFLGKQADVVFTPLFAYGAPAAGAVAFVLAYLLWRLGLGHYQGTGT